MTSIHPHHITITPFHFAIEIAQLLVFSSVQKRPHVVSLNLHIIYEFVHNRCSSSSLTRNKLFFQQSLLFWASFQMKPKNGIHYVHFLFVSIAAEIFRHKQIDGKQFLQVHTRFFFVRLCRWSSPPHSGRPGQAGVCIYMENPWREGKWLRQIGGEIENDVQIYVIKQKKQL